MTRLQRITEKLTSALQPTRLEVKDISHLHAGHAGAGTETHFNIVLASDQLKGLPRIAQHRRINDLLAEEFTGGLHALSLHILT